MNKTNNYSQIENQLCDKSLLFWNDSSDEIDPSKLLSLKTIEILSQRADEYLQRDSSEESISQCSALYEKIDLVKIILREKLFTHSKNLIEKAKTNQITPNDHLKALRLMVIAKDSLQIENSYGCDKQQLAAIVNELQKVIDKEINQPKKSIESSQALVRSTTETQNEPNYFLTLPGELVLLLMTFLSIKELGRMASVSQSHLAYADHPAVWEDKCLRSFEVNKDLMLNHPSFKKLYEKETDYKKFTKEGSMLYAKYYPVGTLNLEVNHHDPLLKGKHLKKIVRDALMKAPQSTFRPEEFANYSIPFRLLFCGKCIEDEHDIKSLQLHKEGPIHIIRIQPKPTIDPEK